MRMREITFEEAERAYDILVEHAGARNDERERWSFAYAALKDEHPCYEYRFCGSLGFGGKFRNNGNNDGVPYVDCYREDETPERLRAISNTNIALGGLFPLPSSSVSGG